MSRTSFLSLATALILQLLTLVPATEAKKSKSGGIDVEEENLGGRIAPPPALSSRYSPSFLSYKFSASFQPLKQQRRARVREAALKKRPLPCA
ncbi:hypothetical protein H2199_004998 [Coniosporium tulheliwenetii]|uniref:Uncharacterized protein n=1 Tax=Coniosporium tulheliwenetii TaxID=3383036 RepID=A0ACC2Z292_9PEZI|nr:hypothetical protein H2199_004998 [Cladosporium sp. JES 115]